MLYCCLCTGGSVGKQALAECCCVSRCKIDVIQNGLYEHHCDITSLTSPILPSMRSSTWCYIQCSCTSQSLMLQHTSESLLCWWPPCLNMASITCHLTSIQHHSRLLTQTAQHCSLCGGEITVKLLSTIHVVNNKKTIEVEYKVLISTLQ